MARDVEYDWHLVEWMSALDVTQADLIRATDFPKAKMSELVNGKSRYNRDVVNTLSRALHIRPYELLMHPEDANSIRRLRDSALTIAAENLPNREDDQEPVRKIRK